ncbi:lipopolysaccharide-induced tumor necrosis factor-alpha factor homolog isoform X2 [Panonychus citri]|uniref:lipopolysaccharide-induced tumor necrosis factor-alpha factor homolog isoform X2 n=1 Tax=Panonychus citri TaxID=50023 RepID=UPI0023074FB5|nr:lipopolysaccharide-induced tumor necrosis factor-alpha factor homolog isoform X2 [Panonychus citri]
MEEDKRFDYGASYSFDRPPPYDYNPNTYGAGPSSFTYNSVTNQDPMKPSAPIQSQSLTGSIQPTPAVNNVQIHISDKFGPYSQNAICPHCNQYIITKAEPVSGALTWFTCLGLILIGCFICCCLIPFCCNSCRNVDHKCPNCKRKIGHYTRMC